jgi:hypothetical protein
MGWTTVDDFNFNSQTLKTGRSIVGALRHEPVLFGRPEFLCLEPVSKFVAAEVTRRIIRFLRDLRLLTSAATCEN